MQIDYIPANARYRNNFASVKTYPDADIHSDHHPLVEEYRTSYKKVQQTPPKKYDIRKLKDGTLKHRIGRGPKRKFVDTLLSWVDRVTNGTVLERMRKEEEVIYTIKKRKAFQAYNKKRHQIETQNQSLKGKCLEREGLEEEEYHGSRAYEHGIRKQPQNCLEKQSITSL
ncbi:hypothetical protein Trydic_g8384 [Trypoxylus dichotomus]